MRYDENHTLFHNLFLSGTNCTAPLLPAVGTRQAHSFLAPPGRADPESPLAHRSSPVWHPSGTDAAVRTVEVMPVLTQGADHQFRIGIDPER